MKKLWLNIKIFFFYLFRGLQNADNLAFTAQKDVDPGVDNGIEQQKEVNNVYKDMLKGELTQEVIELRHEMYFSERLSHKYEYGGNGRAIKKSNLVYDFGRIERSDGLPVILVQENKEDNGSLMDYGIYHTGEEVELSEKAKGNLGVKGKRDFTINIQRDFTPRFRLEQHATKIVVKEMDDTHSLLDIYVPQAKSQFSNIDKFFLSELQKIYMGDLRSDLINFSQLDFITCNAAGENDLVKYAFKNIKFDNIIKFEESYVLRFTAENDEKHDFLDEVYDEATEELSRTHAPRKNNTVSAEVFMKELNDEQFDEKQAGELLKDLKES